MICSRSSTRPQEAEALVYNSNRRHQIVLNIELKRLEMEKRMLERYFYFERAILKTKQTKLLQRQRELSIEPKIAPSEELRKNNSSVFVTTVSLEKSQRSRLPPVMQRGRSLGRATSRARKQIICEPSKGVAFQDSKGDQRTKRSASTWSPPNKGECPNPENMKEIRQTQNSRRLVRTRKRRDTEETDEKGRLDCVKELKLTDLRYSSIKEQNRRTRNHARAKLRAGEVEGKSETKSSEADHCPAGNSKLMKEKSGMTQSQTQIRRGKEDRKTEEPNRSNRPDITKQAQQEHEGNYKLKEPGLSEFLSFSSSCKGEVPSTQEYSTFAEEKKNDGLVNGSAAGGKSATRQSAKQAHKKVDYPNISDFAPHLLSDDTNSRQQTARGLAANKAEQDWLLDFSRKSSAASRTKASRKLSPRDGLHRSVSTKGNYDRMPALDEEALVGTVVRAHSAGVRYVRCSLD